ncbi:hypothetical protein ABZ612_30675 [Streptomyces avermitilis]|uniref:DDE-type integrase/transposase/recombinase n=1 Tax=Streptomyces avermitilis TaxID=33903 RepID=UPI00340CD760
MAELGLAGRKIRRRGGLTRPGKRPAFADFVRRDFTADAPDHVWCGDMTEMATGAGKLYLATVIDLFSRRLHVVVDGQPVFLLTGNTLCKVPQIQRQPLGHGSHCDPDEYRENGALHTERLTPPPLPGSSTEAGTARSLRRSPCTISCVMTPR